MPEELQHLRPNEFAIVKSDKSKNHEIVARRRAIGSYRCSTAISQVGAKAYKYRAVHGI